MKESPVGLKSALAALAVGFGLLASPASALTLNIDFTIDALLFDDPMQFSTPEFTGGLNVGDTFGASLELEQDAGGFTSFPFQSLSVDLSTLGGPMLAFGGGGAFTGSNGGPQGPDTLELEIITSVLVDTVASLSVYSATLTFTDQDGAALDSGGLPPFLDFNLFETIEIDIKRLGNLGDTESLQASALSIVPVPAALPLMLTALGGFGLLAWRRRKSA